MRPSATSDEPPSGDLTLLLQDWSAGDAKAGESLFNEVYPQLLRLASHLLQRYDGPASWQPTALVHEFYLKVAGQKRARWHNRQQFFAVAAKNLRRLIVDRIRYRARGKRGGDLERASLEDEAPSVDGINLDLLALEEALRRLEVIDPRAAKVVELRYFAGLDHDETAAALKIGRATVGRRWRFARSWLRQILLRRV